MNFNPENVGEVTTSLVVFGWAMLFVFFWCECGKIVTTGFAMFDYELWQCKWYLFPIEMQQMLAFIMSNTQEPATLQGYGNIVCTRDTFKRVIDWLFSNLYVLILTFSIVLLFHSNRQLKVDFPISWRLAEQMRHNFGFHFWMSKGKMMKSIEFWMNHKKFQ